ncbi:hypothetical protein QWJ34_24965 [Saccharibacillus sp. CPCC 101409]|uniref:hypothetical protein n=1 Tax=Saccharibacillus sp. CPCC 101409 TaxID=3058041 RepID=UPI0026711DE0|nr:hypothetical protein [Saccharibacillus sp. CPCC 101409]MDO3413039.1 hypothetical protein [Saccharibacillus sp. CPCC 101409]
MIRKMIGVLAGIAIAFTAGCGSGELEFEPNVLTDRDMCVVKTEDAKSRICYGTSREEAEKTAGEAQETYDTSSGYADGLALFYREDRVVGIDLREESIGVYQTARGAKVGMSRDELIGLYGDQYLKVPNQDQLAVNYYYDTENKKLLTDVVEALQNDRDEAGKVRIVSSMLEKDGSSKQIGIIDQKMAIYLE